MALRDKKGRFIKGCKMPEEIKRKMIGREGFWKGKIRENISKENHYKWKGGTSRFHRMEAKRSLERYYNLKWGEMHLPKNAVIHHINEDFTDNSFENLCVMTRNDHISYHNKKRIQDNPQLKYWGINRHLGGD